MPATLVDPNAEVTTSGSIPNGVTKVKLDLLFSDGDDSECNVVFLNSCVHGEQTGAEGSHKDVRACG